MATIDGPRIAPTEAAESMRDATSANTPLSGASLSRRSRTRTSRSRAGSIQTAPTETQGKGAGPSTAKAKKFGDADVLVPPPNGTGGATKVVMGSAGNRARTPTSTTSTSRLALADAGAIQSLHKGQGAGTSVASRESNEASARKRCQSLPRRLASKAGSSSDSSSQPSPATPFPIPGTSPIVSSASRDEIRQSIISTTSSSVYPASTISRSGSVSTTRFFSDDDDVLDSKLREFSSSFDVDDVSERLRLLVTNSYFLPPAHSKPALSHLGLSVPKTPTKPASPGFLDIFRLGKSRSKPTTPEGEPSAPVVPILRTTSDSTTASGWIPTQGYSRSAPPSPAPHEYMRPSKEANRAPRVVVVRERMDNLELAAKEAEEVLKTRGESNSVPFFVDDVVDPTDAVDVPHSNTEVAHLMVGDAMDAAELADALVPPATSPALWSLDSQEVNWRKAILHQAVGHSLNNSSMSSSAGMSAVSPTSPSSLEWSSSMALAKGTVGRPIIDQTLIEREENERSKTLRPSKSESRLTARKAGQPIRTSPGQSAPSTSRVSIQALRRVGSPPVPPVPLAPPPRRPLLNSLYSLSQVDLSGGAGDVIQDTTHAVRKSMSSPALGHIHEHGVNTRAFVLTPPPLARPSRRSAVSPILPEEAETRDSSPVSERTDGPRYSDEKPPSALYVTPRDSDEMLPRPSVSVSVSTYGRPSMSDYSQPSPSPTQSAFQDALFDARSSTSSIPRISIDGVEHTPHRDIPRRSESSVSRRPSPLRSQAFARSPTYPILGSSSSSREDDFESSDSRSIPASPTTMQPILAPPPTTPPLPDFFSPPPTTPPLPDFSASPGSPPAPILEQRSRMSPGPLAVRIPSRRIKQDIHTAPVPASPISFFDSIEEQSIALDALDSSDEEEDNAAQQINDTQSARIYMDTRTNASTSTFSISSAQYSITRQGNFSTPYLTPSQASVHSLPASATPSFDLKRNKPVSNVPSRGTFFSGKKGKGKGISSVSPLDIGNYDQRQSIGAESMASIRKSEGERPGTAGSGQASVDSHGSAGRRDASLEMFEGMLTKHLQAEKDVMKRIADNASSLQKRRR
ncbi:hypothetical protein OE88DRAFT_1809140 [Heliocybe sulcata]|uniref:Uncharacterized protein n=1 Tax=Heliocybe sulcata TaxID=5364 RepID=A0A5C3MYK7_9AGAM|nr:hypothetical protein OE88DRAFT_1809140 [Heliocybe sulcata]